MILYVNVLLSSKVFNTGKAKQTHQKSNKNQNQTNKQETNTQIRANQNKTNENQYHESNRRSEKIRLHHDQNKTE